jgi:hypothetical protein
MKVRELIEALKQFDPEMLVVKYKEDGNPRNLRWQTMDGHWFQKVDVVKIDNPLSAGDYRESEGENETVTALEL